MTDSQTEEVAVPRSFTEAKRLVRRIALILREIARLELRRNKRKANIDAYYDKKLEPLRDEYRPMVQALFHYVVGAHETLFVSRAVVNFVHGTIKFTTGKPLLVTNDDELIKTLEQLGRDDLIIVTKAPDKKAIAKETELLKHLPQARIGKSATYTLSIDPSPLGGSKSLTEKHTVTD